MTKEVSYEDGRKIIWTFVAWLAAALVVVWAVDTLDLWRLKTPVWLPWTLGVALCAAAAGWIVAGVRRGRRQALLRAGIIVEVTVFCVVAFYAQYHLDSWRAEILTCLLLLALFACPWTSWLLRALKARKAPR